MSHLLFLFMRDLILIQGKMKFSSYGQVFIWDFVFCRPLPYASIICCKVVKLINE